MDATPVEGYDAIRLNCLLAGRGLMDPEEFGVSALVQFGVHDPSRRPHPKLRRPVGEVVEYVR